MEVERYCKSYKWQQKTDVNLARVRLHLIKFSSVGERTEKTYANHPNPATRHNGYWQNTVVVFNISKYYYLVNLKERRGWLYEPNLKKKKTKLHFDIDKVTRKRDYDHHHAGSRVIWKGAKSWRDGCQEIALFEDSAPQFAVTRKPLKAIPSYRKLCQGFE